MAICIDNIIEDEVLKNHNLVMVEIGADWSGASQIVAPVIEKIRIQYKQKLKYVKINLDDNQDIVEKYFITEIPSFLFFKNGKYIDCIKGCMSENEFHIRIQTWL